ncbi:sucrose transport protein SUC9-like [Arachis stenosperma]|uniref:sucrose transport protein SUC9-like n=1 Tax=Arachis stenosperma TaxID=217475 RepID=UPI0025AC78D5|nr:sucrose transport protein SUC9-like [Arachis stenosperma]
METTKTSFHTEIGSAGVEPDSVGEFMAIKEEAMSSPTESSSTPAEPISVWKLVLVASIAVGIHLVDAVQIAWLIPIYVDNTDKLGWWQRPFMFAGAVGTAIVFLTIEFAKDIGYSFGDNLSEYTQHRALIIFGIGLWMLEISINMNDARCRDFLDDFASRDQPKIRLAYQFFSFFIAVRNELGYLAALFSRFDVMLAFTVTKTCDRFCANLKSISYY